MRDLGAFVDQEVYPQLFERLHVAFPEFSFQRRGDSWVADVVPADFPHPVQDRRPGRVVVYADRPWLCKVHGYAGGVRILDYVNGGRKPRGEDFLNAVRRLCDLAGVPFPERRATSEEIERTRYHESRRNILERAIYFLSEFLWSQCGTHAREYLHSRGFADDDLKNLEVGYYPSREELESALRKAGADLEEARGCGLLQDTWAGYAIFPWRDASGNLLTLYGRYEEKTPPEGKPKTYALPGEGTKGSPLYLDRALKARHHEIVSVEGVTDGALLQVRGDTRAIAYVGASFTEGQIETLKRYQGQITTVFLCGDPDGGGDRGTLANVENLTKAGIRAYVCPRLPDGVDPDEFVAQAGLGEWKKRVNKAAHAFRFIAEKIITDHKPEDGWTDSTRDAALNAALQFEQKVPEGREEELDQYLWEPILSATGANKNKISKRRKATAAHRKAELDVEKRDSKRESLIPPGEYLLRITAGNPHTAKTGKRAHRFVFVIASGPHRGKSTHADLWLTKKALHRYKAFLKALGHTSGFPEDPGVLVGQYVAATLAIESYRGRVECRAKAFRKATPEEIANAEREAEQADDEEGDETDAENREALSPDEILRLVMPDVNVLGELDGGVQLFPQDSRRLIRIPDIRVLEYSRLAQIGGETAFKNMAPPGSRGDSRPKDKTVAAAIGVVARRRQLGKFRRFGQGVWPLDHIGSGGLLIVNGDELFVWNGRRARRWTGPPIIRRLLLEPVHGRRWCDAARVVERARALTIAEMKGLVERLVEIFARWRWRHSEDALLSAALVGSIAIQSVWIWRPQIWVSGQRDSGKSTLMAWLNDLFGSLSLCREGGVSEAGLRQELEIDGRVILIDEFERREQRKGVLQLLRSAGRGGWITKGTTGHRPVQFFIKHMAVISSIEIGLHSAADRSRFIILELLRPEQRRDPVKENSDELEALREELFAVSLRVALPARDLARRLAGRVRVDGIDGRLVEGYSVPAAWLASATGMSEDDAATALTEHLERAVVPTDSGEVVEDEEALLREIAFARVRVAVTMPTENGGERTEHREMGVAQILSSGNGNLLEQLEAKGIGLVAKDRVFLVATEVDRHLMDGTRFRGLSLRELLLRVPGASAERQRLAGAGQHRGVEIPLEALCGASEPCRAAGTAEGWHSESGVTF